MNSLLMLNWSIVHYHPFVSGRLTNAIRSASEVLTSSIREAMDEWSCDFLDLERATVHFWYDIRI